MKTNCWLFLGTILATSAVAQVNTNVLPEIPAPASGATAPVAAETTNAVTHVKAPVHKKRVVKKISEPAVTLVPGPAKVIPPNLNVRGQAGLKGEVIAHLKKGETVDVLAQINLDKHTPDEPSQWAKIALPAGTKVWVSAHFVDATNNTVSVKRLNLRAGPGENYSVLGIVEQGAVVNQLSTKGNWIEIEAPSSAFAFVAAMYLDQSTTPAETVAKESTPPSAETTVATTETIPVPETNVTNPPAETAVATTETTPATNTAAPTTGAETPTATVEKPAETAATLTTTNTAEVDTNLPPPPPRIVSHEGYVRPSVSVVAPTYYELYDPVTGRAINYLYSSTTNLNLAIYNGSQIIVTGEEGLAARWAATPVLTIQRIYVISTNPPTTYQRVTSPRASQQ